MKIFLAIDEYAKKKIGFGSFLALIKSHFAVTDDITLADAIFVFGGDGAMLKAVHKHHEFELPFFGFNFGHLGFMMHDATEQRVLDILRERYHLICQPLLKATFFDSSGNEIESKLALNDIAVNGDKTVANLRVKVAGQTRFDLLNGDGIIISTAAGSTAYNASAGGEIVPIGTNSIVLTGISIPLYHKWETESFPLDTEISVEALNIERRPVYLAADGIIIPKACSVQVKPSDEVAKIGYAISQNYYQKILDMIARRQQSRGY